VSTRRGALALAFASLALAALFALPPLAGSSSRFGETLGFESCLALLALAFAAPSRRGIRDRLWLGRGALGWRSLALLVLGTLAWSHALDGVYRLVAPTDRGALFQFESELAGVRGAALGIALLSFALLPGISEELFFRGLVQRGLQARLGPIASIALASLCFGALHLDPIHAALAALLGVYLGAGAYLAGSVRASMACHIANNAAAILGAAAAPELGPLPTGSALLAAAFSLGVLGWLWRQHGSATRPRNGQNGQAPGLQKSC